MVQEFMEHLKYGPSSVPGAILFGICVLAIVWLALAFG